MLETQHPLTLQEFFTLSSEEGDITYELIEGQAISKMSPKFFHSKLTRTFLNLLEQWCQQRGEVCPEWSIKLTRQGQDWVPTPDILYVSYERLSPDWDEDAACPVPPDLVIEIISPGQTFEQMAAKAMDYLAAGVLRVWVVDSQTRSITVFSPDANPMIYQGETLLTDVLFSGLELTAAQIFSLARIPLN